MTKQTGSRTTTISTLCAMLLIMLYVYVALSKWIDMGDYQHSMLNQPFPKWMAMLFVWTLPPIEAVVAILLMFQRTQLTGFTASLILMVSFTLYITAIMLNFFPRVPCSCGGIIRELSWGQHLWFNLFFIAVSFLGIRFRKKQDSNDFDFKRQVPDV